MRGEYHGFTFVPLLNEPEASRSLELLTSRLAATPATQVSCVKPPLGGMAFITAAGAVSDMLNSWWVAAVPAERLPVLILLHEPGLEAWLRSVDAEAVVGVSSVEEPLYAEMRNVRAVVTRDVRELTDHVINAYGGCFDKAEPAGVGAETPRPEAPPSPTPLPYPPPTPPAYSPPAPSPSRQAGFDLRGLVHRAAGLLSAAPPRGWLPEELTGLVLSHTTGRIVAVSSRAGGVGKTAIAAALGIVYGEAVEGSGWCAAVVDQNIGNPDQWGRLSLTARVPTVSDIMARIEAGQEWSVPAWSRTPALAVYPERRDVAQPYPPALVARFASQLRGLHAVSVVDLPNRIPALTSAEAAVSAAWLRVADLLILPTSDDPTRLQGVLDYLDAPLVRGDAQASYRRVRVVVPYIRSSLRAIRDDPGVRAMLDQVRARVVAVVEIPRDEKATLAIVNGQPITEVDPNLRGAFVELALAVARALRG